MVCVEAVWSLVVVQSLSLVPLFVTPWTVAHSPPCHSLSPRVFSSSCPLSQSCLPTILSSAIPSSPAPNLSFLASGAFPVSWRFASGGQSIGASASESALPMNTQG